MIISAIIVFGSIASLAIAAPQGENPPDPVPAQDDATNEPAGPYIVDELSEIDQANIGDGLSNSIATNKGSLNFKFKDKLPGCGDDEDPSYDRNPPAEYPLSSDNFPGVSIPKQGDNHPCTTSYCWNEYYLVDEQIEYAPWKLVGGSIDCQNTTDCAKTVQEQIVQTCTQNQIADSVSGGVKLDLTLSKVIGDWTAGGTLGGNADFGKTITNGNTICTTHEVSSNSCKWADSACHQLYSCDRNIRVYGYVVRACRNSADQPENVAMNIQRASDGVWVRGQSGFSITVPLNTILSCDGRCDVSTSDQPLKEPGPRRPLSEEVKQGILGLSG